VGNLLVLAAAFTWAISTAFMKPIVTKYRPLPIFTASLPGALPILLIYGAVPTLHQDFGAVSAYGWLMFGHVTLLSGVLSFVCFYEGVRQIGPSASTTYQFMVPIFAALFAALFLGDKLQPLQFLGMLVVLGGVALATAARQANVAA
jgi:drug/metabolite transporter (DMT)-like permease